MKRITIIGGGPGGYVAAIRAANLGAEVHLVEREKLGGTCLNVGCIPTKTLLKSALLYKHLKSGSVAGLRVPDVKLDWRELQTHKQAITKKLVGGVEALVAANKISLHRGTGKFESKDTVSVDGRALPKSDAIIIASGSQPVLPKLPGIDLSGVLDSTEVLKLDSIPSSLCIIGGGVIGIEFASIFSAVGVKTTVIEMMPEILPPVDRQIASRMREILSDESVEILTDSKLTKIQKNKTDSLQAVVETTNGQRTIDAETVLVAIGRKPLSEGLGLEKVGVETDRGAILVDECFETNIKGIFAIGDCNAQNMLAHAASAQGEAVAEYIMKGDCIYNTSNIPSCIYTDPEIASTGMTEDQAKEAGKEIVVGMFDLSANGKALVESDKPGFVKIIADKNLGEIYGVHIIGPHATDMISEAVAVIGMEGLAEDLIRIIHPHPTVSEAIGEAARALFGNAIHWPPKRL